MISTGVTTGEQGSNGRRRSFDRWSGLLKVAQMTHEPLMTVANLVDDLKRRFDDQLQRLAALEGPLNIEQKRARILDLDDRMSGPEFWADAAKASATQKERTQLEQELKAFVDNKKSAADGRELIEVAGEDEASLQELQQEADRVETAVRRLEMSRMLRGQNDKNDAIVSLAVGQGGADAQEFTEMLLRMYTRYAEQRGLRAELSDLVPSEPSGIKSATLVVRGEYAYGFLKAEIGVHRLVRISPFSGKRETSFAGVWVIPDVADDIDIDINPADLDIITMRSGGAGGQHVNKTESAVQVMHIPTKIIVRCQQERSQLQNKMLAIKLLKSRLYDLEMKKRLAERDKVEAQKMEASFGSQIRNYVMAPYQICKDLRSGHETSQVHNVLDGDIQPFIEAYLLDSERNAT
jgi:peptide chain release factor 2